jgi:hypothetical protein
MIATKLVPPHDIRVADEYIRTDMWKGSTTQHPFVLVEIPRSGMKKFAIDELCAPIIGELWDRGVYTTECCQEGYVGIDPSRGALKSLNVWQKTIFLKGIAERYFGPMSAIKFGLAEIKKMNNLLILVWGDFDTFMHSEKKKETIKELEWKWLL